MRFYRIMVLGICFSLSACGNISSLGNLLSAMGRNSNEFYEVSPSNQAPIGTGAKLSLLTQRGYDSSAFLVSPNDRAQLQNLLDTHSRIRLLPGNYSESSGGPAALNIRSDQQIFGLNGTITPPIVIAPGTRHAVLSNLNAGRITFSPGVAIENNVFVRMQGDAYATGSSVEKNLFLGWGGSLLFDASTGGYTRYNRFIRAYAHTNAPLYLRFIGNSMIPSTGNTFLFYNFLTPHVNPSEFKNIPDLSMIGIDAESWNWDGTGTGAVIQADSNVGDLRLMGTNGGDNIHAASDPRATSYFDSAAKHFLLINDVAASARLPKSRFRLGTRSAVLLSTPDASSALGSVSLDDSATSFFRAADPSQSLNALASADTAKLRETLIGRQEIRKDEAWPKPEYAPVPDPAGANWQNNLANQPDSLAYIQGLVNQQGIAVLPAGTYYISGPIRFQNGQGLVGAGMENTIIIAKSSGIDMVVGDEHYPNPFSVTSMTLSDLTLQGGANGIHHHESGSGGGAQYNGIMVSHVSLREMSNAGIFIDSIFAWDNNLIDHVNFVNNKYGIYQRINPNRASGESPGITFLDKNLFYQNQFIGNELAVNLQALRANNLDVWSDCLFSNNRAGAFDATDTFSAVIANSDFISNGGTSVIKNDGWPMNIVSSRFVANANSNTMLSGAYAVEGSSFSGASAQIVGGGNFVTSFYNSYSSDMLLGTVQNGFFFNNQLQRNTDYNLEGISLSNSRKMILLPAAVTQKPSSQFLIGKAFDFSY